MSCSTIMPTAACCSIRIEPSPQQMDGFPQHQGILTFSATRFQNKHQEINSNIHQNTVNMFWYIMSVTHYIHKLSSWLCGCHYEGAHETCDPSAEELRSLAMRKVRVLMPFNFPSHRSTEENLFTPLPTISNGVSYGSKGYIYCSLALNRPLLSGTQQWPKHHCPYLTGHQKHKTEKTG